MNLEKIVLSNLAFNEPYTRKVLPYLKTEYFTNKEDKVVYEIIDRFVKKYNDVPTKEALAIELSNRTDISDDEFESCKTILNDLDTEFETKMLPWAVDQTENFCKEKAYYLAALEVVQGVQGKSKYTVTEMAKLLQDAAAVSFDTNIGHDYFNDADSRYDQYHKKTDKIPFDLELLNKATQGGAEKKTLNVILAGTNVGKSMFMCHLASSYLMQGKNVLYITLEMADWKISQRIDANLLNIPLNEMLSIPKDLFDKKIARVKARTAGRLIVKEYPTASAGSANFRFLLEELALKQNFVPDVVFIDYINICISSRLKGAANVNSYQFVKVIAEELRGLAVEKNFCLWTATQTTRSGYSSSELEDVAESFGLPATADFMIGLSTSEEMIKLQQMMVKQLKNRYGDKNFYNKFVVGVDSARQYFYDTEQNSQTLSDDKPVMDKSDTGERIDAERSTVKRETLGSKPKFRGFK
jgi:replicative DNA helicase